MDESNLPEQAGFLGGISEDALFAAPNDLLLSSNEDMDLTLANVDGDNFSFWALEHFGTSNITAAQQGVTVADTDYDLELNLDRFPTASSTLAITGVGLITQQFTHDSNPRLASSVGSSASIATPLEAPTVSHTTLQPKIGARFSRDALKILKNWLTTHSRKPYPNEEERAHLEQQTGLNHTQITNWLANARRRSKIQRTRSISPSVHVLSSPMNIPPRRGTPAAEQMNPLQRWQNSPPENEPASVTAIASAIQQRSCSSHISGIESPYSFNLTDDGSGRSICKESSTSSLGNSQSSDQSAYSRHSRGSFGSLGSLGSLGRGRRRRRKNGISKGVHETTPLQKPLRTYQCTFCCESFKSKYDWQRHEKGLHLSLERWICSPHGPTATLPETKVVCCVFCGHASPDEAHLESHNYAHCQERPIDERNFHRSDHLRQHLKLVHDVKLLPWSMESWKVSMPQIKSRCGFCNITLDTWQARTDHIADHFKSGASMETWQGDWGFDPHINAMVENYIPPYMIHEERNTPLPFAATQAPNETPRSAYELIKYELVFFIQSVRDVKGSMPTVEELRVEACRIILASDILIDGRLAYQPSWLKELLMSSEKHVSIARHRPIRGSSENQTRDLRINGKEDLFEDCALERGLEAYVKARRFLGLTAMDDELQAEACRIVGENEAMSIHPSEEVANFILRLINGSTSWLANFRQRTHLPRSEDIRADFEPSCVDPKTIDSTIHNYSRLEARLADFVRDNIAAGKLPTDEDLQQQARIIVYDNDDPWNQTAADSSLWLEAFKQRHHLSHQVASRSDNDTLGLDALDATTACGNETTDFVTPSHLRGDVYTRVYRLNNTNYFHQLERELGRFVASALSPHNPNQHIPSDEELRHQSRWIVYEDGDQWNITSADNAEWLRRFKRSYGITYEGPGLHDEDINWEIALAGDPTMTGEEAEILKQNAQVSLVADATSAPGLRQELRVEVSEQQLDDMLKELAA